MSYLGRLMDEYAKQHFSVKVTGSSWDPVSCKYRLFLDDGTTRLVPESELMKLGSSNG